MKGDDRTSDKVFDGNQTLDDLNLSYTYAADKQITAETIVGEKVQSVGFTAAYDARLPIYETDNI
jgi:hypothetical protein